LEFCKRAIEICDEFWMFGISEGTLEELTYALFLRKSISLFLDGFDSEWKVYYSRLGPAYNNPLERIFK